ncbi:MAG: hypothetical protein HY537_14480 [Deltaproteobacteria bacterium]|nr:hypothetical protein [Deltaproteobacteria bacterium]
MKVSSSLFSLLIAFTAYGDSAKIEISNASSAPPQRGVEVFDNSLWSNKQEEVPKPKTSKGIYTGQERYIAAEEQKLNQGQLDEIQQTCKIKKKDPDAFRQCYRQETDKVTAKVKEEQETIEKRQAVPYRSLPNEEKRRKPADDDEEE